MVRPFDRGKVEISQSLGVERGIPKEETPFNIALIGNFSGSPQAAPQKVGIASRSMILVDRDNFDEVLARIAPTVSLPMEGSEALVLRLRELEDFHPEPALGERGPISPIARGPPATRRSRHLPGCGRGVRLKRQTAALNPCQQCSRFCRVSCGCGNARPRRQSVRRCSTRIGSAGPGTRFEG